MIKFFKRFLMMQTGIHCKDARSVQVQPALLTAFRIENALKRHDAVLTSRDEEILTEAMGVLVRLALPESVTAS
jgi:hypothetical protein